MNAQIDLFAELPPGECIRSKRKPCKRPFRAEAVQLSFELVARIESRDYDQIDDDPWVSAPIVHRTVSAAGAAPLAIRAPASVWDMAFTPISVKRQAPPEKRAITRVERADGVVRCLRIIEQETPEWKSKEAARRARQIVPRPPKTARTISKALQALVGK